MEHLDARKNSLKDGLYRDAENRFYVLYLFNDGGSWKFETPDIPGQYDLPLNFSKDLIPIDDPVKEIKYFRALKRNNIANFIEKELKEDIEERRRLR